MNQIPSASQILLRPLTLIISCTIFVILILVMGLMDLNRLDRSLVNFMEVRGLDVAEKIERESQVGFNSIMQMLRGESAGETLYPSDGRNLSDPGVPDQSPGQRDSRNRWQMALPDHFSGGSEGGDREGRPLAACHRG